MARGVAGAGVSLPDPTRPLAERRELLRREAVLGDEAGSDGCVREGR